MKNNLRIPKEEKKLMMIRIEELITSGFTNQTSIANALNISQSSVHRFIKEIEQNLADRNKKTVSAKRAVRISQLEHILKLALESYTKSLKDDIETTTSSSGCVKCMTNGEIDIDGEIVVCPDCFGNGEIRSKTVKRKHKSGDSSMLRVAADCIKECARIQGVYIDNSKARATLKQLTMEKKNGEIKDKVEELYIDAPVDLLINAKRVIEELKLTKDTTIEVEAVRITE